MYDWSIKKNQYWVFATQERDCALSDSNQGSNKKIFFNLKNTSGIGTQVEKGKQLLFILHFFHTYFTLTLTCTNTQRLLV